MADAEDSKSFVGNNVGVQVPSRAPSPYNPNQSRQLFAVGDGFGLLLYFDYNFFECTGFPCKLIKNLERSYIKRYGVSLIENSRSAKENGISNFFEAERRK